MKAIAERMHKIILHGKLKKYGPIYDIYASSPAQVVRALVLQIPAFAKDLEEGYYRVVLGKNVRKGLSYEPEDFGHRGAFLWDLGKESTIHLIPIVQGRKSGGGFGKAIIGAVIMVAAVVLSVPTGGTSLMAGAAATGAAAAATATGTVAATAATGLAATAFTVLGANITYGSIAVFGAALMFSGVSTLMGYNQKSNYSNRESPDQRASFFFNGPVNVSEQGSCIPLVYGRCRTGSVVASAGLTIEQI